MEDEEEIELPFTDEELQEKFDGKLEREINGPTYEVISKILKAVVQKKITVPGSFIGKIRHEFHDLFCQSKNRQFTIFCHFRSQWHSSIDMLSQGGIRIHLST